MSLQSIIADARRAALARDEEERRRKEEEKKQADKADTELASLYKDILREQLRASQEKPKVDELKQHQASLQELLVKEAKQKLYDPQEYAKRMQILEPEKWEKVKVAEAIPPLPEREREILLQAIREGREPATNVTLQQLYGVPEQYEYRHRPPVTDYEKTEAGFRQKLGAEIEKAKILAGAKENQSELMKHQSEKLQDFVMKGHAVKGKDNKLTLSTYAEEILMKYDPLITGKPLTAESRDAMLTELKTEKEIHSFLAKYKERMGNRVDAEFLKGILNKNPDDLNKMRKMMNEWEEEDKRKSEEKGSPLRYFPRTGWQ